MQASGDAQHWGQGVQRACGTSRGEPGVKTGCFSAVNKVKVQVWLTLQASVEVQQSGVNRGQGVHGVQAEAIIRGQLQCSLGGKEGIDHLT